MVLSVPRVCNMVFQRCNEIDLGELKGAAKNVNNLQYLEIGASHPCITLFFWRDGIIWYHLQLKTEPQITIYLCIPLAAICLFVQSLSEHLFNHPSIHPSIQPAMPAMHAVQFNAMQVSSGPLDVLWFDSMYLSQSKANSISFQFIAVQLSACIQPQLPIEPTFYTTLARLSGPPVTSHAFPDASWALPQAPPKMAGQRIRRIQLICVTKREMNIRVEKRVCCIQLGNSNVTYNAFWCLQRCCYELWNLC